MVKRRRVDGRATRPRMPPAYGISSPRKGKLLPWSWAAHRLSGSRGHWIATTRPDGRPHVMIVWGVWLHDVFYFATSRDSRKARNLAVNPQCVVCTERADEAVILEGTALAVSDSTAVKQFAQAYRKKYEEEIDTAEFPVLAVRPRTVFGFISTAEAWAGTATRWNFE